MNRSERRFHRHRIYKKVKTIIKNCWSRPEEILDDPRILGQLVENHMRPCSCPTCKQSRYDRSNNKTETRNILDENEK